MAARLLPLTLVIVLFSFGGAYGDLLPLPGPRPPRPVVPGVDPPDVNLPLLAPTTKIDLQSAVVGVRLRRREGAVVADVQCRFDLVCVQGNQTPQKFTLAFPTSAGDDEGAKDLSLSAMIDGKRAESVSKKTWSRENADGQEQTYHGYIFPAAIARDEKQTVTIKYARELPIQNDTASFTYILRTGAEWNAPISRETVRIVAESGLKIKPLTSPSLKPARSSEDDLTWELRDAKPTEDIRVAITVADRR